MQRLRLLPLLLLITGAAVLTLHAQQAAQNPVAAPSQYFAHLLPFIPPIAGAPVTATFVIQVTQPLPGGGTETWHTMMDVARDSRGRTRHELHELVPSSIAEPPLLYIVISDPVSHIRQTVDPVHRRIFKQRLTISPRGESVSGISKGEDLGNKTIDSVETKGVRRTWIIPTEVSASGGPGRAVDETWYSSKLQMIESERRSDSLGRMVTVTMSNVDQNEPPASLFKPPPHFKLSGQSPPGGIPMSIAPPDYDASMP